MGAGDGCPHAGCGSGEGTGSTQAFVDWATAKYPQLTKVASAETIEDAIADADIVMATTSTDAAGSEAFPYFPKHAIKPGALLLLPAAARFDDDFLQGDARLVIDAEGQHPGLHRSGRRSRAPALPSMTTKPPWPVAAADWDASPFTWTLPDMMFSASPTPALPLMVTSPFWCIPCWTNRPHYPLRSCPNPENHRLDAAFPRTVTTRMEHLSSTKLSRRAHKDPAGTDSLS